MMKFEHPWSLTTEHPASSYGLPVFVFQGAAYGPRDKISAFQVADIVKTWADYPGRLDSEKNLAGKFLRQWPDGPQLANVPGLMGRPKKFAKNEMVGVRLDQAVADRCPRNDKGNVDKDFLREAVSRELERRGL